MLKNLALTAALFCLAAPLAHAKDSGETTLKVPAEFCEYALGGNKLALQVHKPADSGKPVFLFLPGSNRSLLLDHPVAQVLALAGAGMVTMNYSAHPLSRAGSTPGDPKPVTAAELAEQVNFIRAYVAKMHGLNNLIPVALSYSGVVSPFLDFPLIIDLVPMTSADEQNRQLAAYRRSLTAGAAINPFAGQAIARGMLDTAYRSVWGSEVDDQIEELGVPESRRAEMIEGMVQLSRAAEGFSWENSPPKKNVRRDFILGANENRALLKHQVQTFLRLQREGYAVRAIVIKEAGHMIFNDQPAALAVVLAAAAVREAQGALLTVVTPSTGAVESLDAEAAISYLERL